MNLSRKHIVILLGRILFGTLWGAMGAVFVGGTMAYGGFASMIVLWMAGQEATLEVWPKSQSFASISKGNDGGGAEWDLHP